MERQDSHLSDRDLLMALDGELAPRDVSCVEAHLAACWTCRSRKLDLEQAIGDFVHVYQDRIAPLTPAPEGTRALLKAHLAELARTRPSFWRLPAQPLKAAWLAGAITGAIALAWFAVAWFGVARWTADHQRGPELALAAPDPSLTPGAAVLVSPGEICREIQPKNKRVPVGLERRVFEEYGLSPAEARAYEVDYLITPALGGADDIHNIWPQPYRNTQWNAKVKDALEDRLRSMVCEGQLDLATAQRDIAANWIEAYKKYFRTDHPIAFGKE